MNYYSLYNYVSNSDLGALKDALNLATMPSNIQEIFDFGNLVDTLITEPHLGDRANLRVNNSDGTFLSFSEAQWERAEKMKVSLLKNDFLKMILKDALFQYVFLRKEINVSYSGYDFKIPGRCKFDIYNKPIKIGADIKTTACTSQKSFTESMSFFDYDRQGSWYMDLAKLNKMVYFGVSKKANKKGIHEVFTYAISRGDASYISGKNKYSRLAYQYKNLILNLNI
jgi:hypothetical protein